MTHAVVPKPMLTFAFCTYNRADRLERLVAAMRAQECPVPFEILAVNNNSTDATAGVLGRLADQPGPKLRWVTEGIQGIVAARNRAIAESLGSEILVFVDDDELPRPGLVAAAHHAIAVEKAQCAGGRVFVDFHPNPRPKWLDDDLLGFLAAVDYGSEPLWVADTSTPLWTANIAYDMSLFRDDRSLRFDKRFDRTGAAIGGGSDAIMFRALIERRVRIRYRPDMAVDHFVEPWRLKRRYFLRLHYQGGFRKGRFEQHSYPSSIRGVPPFMLLQALRQSARALAMLATGAPGRIRQAMTATHAFGMIRGLHRRWKDAPDGSVTVKTERSDGADGS